MIPTTVITIIAFREKQRERTSPLLVVEAPKYGWVYSDVCAQEESNEVGLHMQQHCEGVGGVPINISDASGFCEREGREGGWEEGQRQESGKGRECGEGEGAMSKRGVRVCCEGSSG
jgi:hypothetical protein